MIKTRSEVEKGWRAISDTLSMDEKQNLAAQVTRFAGQLPVTRTVGIRSVEQRLMR